MNPLVLLILFFLSLIFLYKWHYKNNQYSTHKNPPPSPTKLPLLGNIHQLGKLPHRSLQSLSDKHGDLMLLHLGTTPTLVVSSSNAAQHIMRTHDLIFSNRPKSTMAHKLLYKGKDIAFANYGEYWRQMKSICVLQLLSSKRVRSFRAIREEETALMVDKVRRQSLSTEPVVVNLNETVIKLTNDVVCRAAFGKKYSEEGGSNFKNVLWRFEQLLGVFSIGDFIPLLGWIDRVTGLAGKADAVAKEFDELLERILEEHQLDGFNSPGDGNKDDKGETVKNFVDVLLEVQRDSTLGLPVDKESIKALILDMFAAGTDTSYSTIEWAMSELLKNPKVMEELQGELRTIAKGKAIINEDDLEKTKYLKAVIKETLRLHPPLPLLVFRESSRDVKINGYDIAAGTQVIINAWAIHRDPTSWALRPDDFYPERFLMSLVDFKGQDFELIPFGAGRRICPGIVFAINTVELALANLVYAFNWALPGGEKIESLGMNEMNGLTIHRQDPLLLVATSYSC